MQAKNFASINDQFDRQGGLLAQVSGSNVDLCYLLGVLVSQIAKSHARVTGCTESEALDGILKSIAFVAEKAPSKGAAIDLSRKYEDEEAGHD